MANVTHRCAARGTSVIFTMNDVTLRLTQVSWIVVANNMLIRIFDDLGVLLLEISTRTDVSPIVTDLPARLVDLTTKSYVCPRIQVLFGV